MAKKYRVKYSKYGFMGNVYNIGEHEFTVSDRELEVYNSVPEVGINKIKEVGRHFNLEVKTKYFASVKDITKEERCLSFFDKLKSFFNR